MALRTKRAWGGLGEKRLLVGCVVAVVLAGGVVLAQDGPLTVLMNLRGRTDANGYLLVKSGAYSGADGPLTVLSNLRGRTDANGYLITTLGAGPLLVGDGTAAAPSYSFASATGTGMFYIATAKLGFATAGGTRAMLDSSGFLSLPSSGKLQWTDGAPDTGTADTVLSRGGAAGKLTLTGTTPMLQLGGTTSSFAAIKSNGAGLVVRLADDSANGPLVASAIQPTTSLQGPNGNLFYSSGVASSPTSCGTSPAITTTNGTAAFVVTGGTGGTATGCSVTMPAAATGWNCNVVNITQTAAHRADRDTRQTASTTTSVTWEYVVVSTGAVTAFTASDVFRGVCFAY